MGDMVYTVLRIFSNVVLSYASMQFLHERTHFPKVQRIEVPLLSM